VGGLLTPVTSTVSNTVGTLTNGTLLTAKR